MAGIWLVWTWLHGVYDIIYCNVRDAVWYILYSDIRSIYRVVLVFDWHVTSSVRYWPSHIHTVLYMRRHVYQVMWMNLLVHKSLDYYITFDVINKLMHIYCYDNYLMILIFHCLQYSILQNYHMINVCTLAR